uniref:CPG4 domain-containing protein n=1 Tax=Meloidogyne hapla TaxID=6305 RepID=A0A1I8BQ41_MELHA
LISHLKCYSNSSLNLKRNCGSLRCGPYNELKLTFNGMEERCKTLLCDLNCAQKVLNKENKCKEGAIKYLIKYSQLQVFYWLKEIFGEEKIFNWKKWPKNCIKLICGNFRREELNEENNNKNCSNLIKEINN